MFDCSCALSLNDGLCTGPDDFKILRFRCQRYAWVIDMEKIFVMVGLDDKDRDATRILWPTEPMDVTIVLSLSTG